MCNLKSMKLSKCPMLVSLFQLLASRSLLLLEELEICDCERLENIITDERRVEDSGEITFDGADDNKSRDSMFPKLKALDIRQCPRLEFILPFLSDRDFPALETIIISTCDNLKYIFGQYQDVKLGSLKEMLLYRLPNFIGFFPARNHPMSSPMEGSSSRHGSKAEIKVDPIKSNIFSWTRKCCHYGRYLKE